MRRFNVNIIATMAAILFFTCTTPHSQFLGLPHPTAPHIRKENQTNFLNADTLPSSIIYDYISSNKYNPPADSIMLSYFPNNLFEYIFDFPTDLRRLYLHKGTYYVYAPSEWGNNYYFKFTKKHVLNYYFDEGAVVGTIDSIQRSSHGILQIIFKDNRVGPCHYKLHLVNAPSGIVLVENLNFPKESRYMLMVDVRKIRQFPIISRFSPDGKNEEFNFDEPDYEAMLQKLK